MPFEQRADLIKRIQTKRNSKVLTYILSDRDTVPRHFVLPGTKANVAPDVKIIMYELLKSLGKQQNLDLFIYTRGGDTNAVWPIVSILREFCTNLEVLVPFRCHSSGTMICLGADKIVMSKMGELSPIDPTTGNQYNPIDELMTRNRKGISVEDLTSYLQLAKDKSKFSLKEDSDILEIFKELTRTVHPLALGNVNRVHTQIRLLSGKLLALHLKEEGDKKRIDEITDQLTEKFYSHLHFINRRESTEILGADVVAIPDDDLETMMMSLLDSYVDALKIRHEFCCFTEMQSDTEKRFNLYSALIETEGLSYTHKTDLKMYQKSEVPPNIQLSFSPGQAVPPIIPGLPKTFSWEVQTERWIKNEGEV